CRIRVFDAQQSCKEDISDAVFTITPAPPVLTYPNGGETLDSGCSYTIQWDTSTLYTSVRLDYSSDNGDTWNTIVNGTSNDGSYSWSTPNSLPTSNYL
ncbi:Ser-Thr-rich GPI-anchored membrane family protein, partial [uncultured Lacinutrix sp.]|uniref:Ser-Thr-rich GPI-anchored membrane family protein n=1 Tax=uncultured Lacinutrix sp. TaxID=574032 RepID=UPI00260ABBD7